MLSANSWPSAMSRLSLGWCSAVSLGLCSATSSPTLGCLLLDALPTVSQPRMFGRYLALFDRFLGRGWAVSRLALGQLSLGHFSTLSQLCLGHNSVVPYSRPCFWLLGQLSFGRACSAVVRFSLSRLLSAALSVAIWANIRSSQSHSVVTWTTLGSRPRLSYGCQTHPSGRLSLGCLGRALWVSPLAQALHGCSSWSSLAAGCRCPTSCQQALSVSHVE